jgi:hypothetical protein
MKRILLLLGIFVAFVAAAGILIVWDWKTLPPSAAPQIDVTRYDRSHDIAAIGQWDMSVTLARTALLSRDGTVLPVDASAVGNRDVQLEKFTNAFRDGFDTQQQIQEFYKSLEDVKFHAAQQLLLTLKQQEKLPGTFATPNVPEGLRTHQDPAISNAANVVLQGLRAPFDEFLVRRAAIDVLFPAASEAYDANRYEDCVKLCASLLAQVDMFGPELKQLVKPELEKLQGRSQEVIDWRECEQAASDSHMVMKLRAYLEKYDVGKPAEKFGEHVPTAKSLLAWKELMGTLASPVADVVRYFELKDDPSASNTRDRIHDINEVKARLAGVSLDAPIRALHDFSREYAYDSAHVRVARSAAITLLNYWLDNDPILKPKLPFSELHRVKIQRTGLEFVGFLDLSASDEDIVTLKNPDNDEERRFFRNALAGKPEYIGESKRERAYDAQYKILTELAKNFNWEPEPLQEFVARVQELQLNEREQVAKKLLELVKYCERFRLQTPTS